MSQRFALIPATALAVCAAWSPLACGQVLFDVQVQSQDGQVVIGVSTSDEATGGINDVTLSFDLGVRVFTEVLGTNFNSSNPGFNVNPTGSPVLRQGGVDVGIEGLGEGAELFIDFVPTTIDGVTSNFFYWDGLDSSGDGDVGSEDFDFAAPTTGQTFGISTQTGFVSVDGAAELVEGGRIDTTSIFEPILNIPGGRLHEHRSLGVLNSIGFPSSNQPDGIYVIALQARVDGFESSDPFFWVFESRNLAETDEERGAVAQLVADFLDENYAAITGVGGLPGDFNADGSVDAADYTVWRDGLGADFTLEDYLVWSENFGATAASSPPSVLAVPEPTTGVLAAFCTLLLITPRRIVDNR